ncbi:MAG TPA: winged helix-turn-helix domain-containing protein [Pyrinomonadaceae bacterium]|nr:winged helix-turn-helix domain-containing protein [Pyrinomonadaceae bacterium]HVQ56846.1 winged helix-turn-helix domain-containing protein [Pyrinomonadaceae bacterium]
MSLSKSLAFSQQNLTEANSKNNCTYEFEDFRLDVKHLMLYRGARTVSLKPKAIETLVALVERRGEVVSNAELMDLLWADSFVEESNLTQNIYLLRKSLGNCADGRPFIENFSRRGYRFNGELKFPVVTEVLLATHTRTQTVIDETCETSVARPRRKWAGIAIAGLAIFGTIAYTGRNILPINVSFDSKNAAAEPFQNFRLERESETGDVTGAKVSPDGKFIVYSDKTRTIWLRNTATDTSVRILEESEAEGSAVAAISPDNNYLYLVRNTKDKKGEISKISLFGGGARQKIAENSWSDASLSPDGKQLSFVRQDVGSGRHSLIVASTDGSGEHTIAISDPGSWFDIYSQATAWSPDGTRIACTGGRSIDGKETWNIKAFIAANGEEVSSIESDPNIGFLDGVVWLPGDKLLVVGGDTSSRRQIYKYVDSSSGWLRITNDLSDYVNVSATADGKTLVALQQDNSGNLWCLPSNGDASEAKQITFGRNLITDASGVSWTPDGKIVYATNAGGKWEISQVDEDGQNQKQLTERCAGNDSCGQAIVSQDGRQIFFHASRAGVPNIWRMDADGANPTQLTDAGGFSPSLVPDGRTVIYVRSVSGVMGLWQVPIEGGETKPFSKIPTAANAAISPDAEQMAFMYYDETAKEQICVAPIRAETPERCFGKSRSFPRWQRDGKAFYYLDNGYKGIWKQPLEGPREMFLGFPGERTNNFAFSPDGTQLVVARSRQTLEIVALTDGK